MAIARTRAAAVLGALGLCLAACGQEEADDFEPAAPQPPRPSLERPPARFGELSGTVTLAGAEARRGGAVDAERAIEVPEGGHAVLRLADGARVDLEGEARARVVVESAAQLILVRGAARMVQPAAGSSPRPPLRLVTPSVSVEIASPGEAYVAHLEGGASVVVALRGVVAVSIGEADTRRRLRMLELAAGQLVSVQGRITEPIEGPQRLADARLAVRALALAPSDPEADRLARELVNEAQRLDQALRWLETETRRGRELTQQHSTSVRQGQRDDERRVQRALADHAQALYRMRQLATARWERLRAQWLRLGVLGPLPAADPVAQRRERVTGLLGL